MLAFFYLKISMAFLEEFYSKNCQKQMDFQILYFQEYALQITRQVPVFCQKRKVIFSADKIVKMKLEHDKYAENIFLTFLTTN